MATNYEASVDTAPNLVWFSNYKQKSCLLSSGNGNKQTQDFFCRIQGFGILQTTNKSTSTSMLLNTINQIIISIIT